VPGSSDLLLNVCSCSLRPKGRRDRCGSTCIGFEHAREETRMNLYGLCTSVSIVQGV
jgi:hypothetical protein